MLLAAARPCTADTAIGVQALALSGHHYDPGNNLNGSGAGALFEITQRWKAVRIYVEGIPVVDTAHTVSPRYGPLTQSFGLFNAVASARLDRGGHFWAGIGSGILAQRTPFLNYPFNGWDQVNASRLAGARYELQTFWPSRGPTFWDLSLAGVPRMHGTDYLTVNFPGGVIHRSEGETAALTDIAADYGIRHGRFEYSLGLRWINFSANFVTGRAADRNVGAGPTLKVLWII
jgi:hypothetical protein